MQLQNLNIDRIIIHQVFRRDGDGNRVKPLQSHDLTRFDFTAMSAFKTRVRDALGEGSKAVRMEIVNQEARDLPKIIDSLIDQDADTFATSSYDVAEKLTDAQQKRNIPGGIVVVFTGTQGPAQTKFLGIIKAEIHSAYEKEVNDETQEISLKFVEEVLLTPGSRLYKTAAFFEKVESAEGSEDLNDKWVVMVSDYQISKADGKAAAQYFYSDFLGCGYPQTSARTTKDFFENTSSFISKMAASDAEKNEYLNALNTYLKVNKSTTVSTSEFAETYFESAEVQDSFSNYMRDAGLPETAFTKDVEHIQTKLKTRKINFTSNVKIIAPSEIFKELIEIETIDGDLDEAGAPKQWTKIIVKDIILDQE